MTLALHVPRTHADLNKEVQSVIEGDFLTTNNNLGTMPANPAFSAVGPDGGSIVITYIPELKKRRKAGSVTRTGVLVLKKAWRARLQFKASDSNVALQKWCKNKSAIGGTVTPAASRSFLKSYYDGTTETFEIFRGCVPEKTNYAISKSGEIIYIVDLICKTFERNQTADGGITLGTGSFASADTAAPWITTDGGNGSFTYNLKKYGIVSFSMDISRVWADQNPSEALEIMMITEVEYNPSGSITVEKSDITLDADQLATTPRAASLVLKSGTMTDTLTNAIFEGHTGPDHDGENSTSLTDGGSFSADDFVSA